MLGIECVEQLLNGLVKRGYSILCLFHLDQPLRDCSDQPVCFPQLIERANELRFRLPKSESCKRVVIGNRRAQIPRVTWVFEQDVQAGLSHVEVFSQIEPVWPLKNP